MACSGGRVAVGRDGPTPSTAEVVGEARYAGGLRLQFLFDHGTDSHHNYFFAKKTHVVWLKVVLLKDVISRSLCDQCD